MNESRLSPPVDPPNLLLRTEISCTFVIGPRGKLDPDYSRRLVAGEVASIPWKRFERHKDGPLQITMRSDDGKMESQDFPYVPHTPIVRALIVQGPKVKFQAGDEFLWHEADTLDEVDVFASLALDRQDAYIEAAVLGDQEKASSLYLPAFSETKDLLSRASPEHVPFLGQLLIQNDTGFYITIRLAHLTENKIFYSQKLRRDETLRTAWPLVAKDERFRLLLKIEDSPDIVYELSASKLVSTIVLEFTSQSALRVKADYMIPAGNIIRSPYPMSADALRRANVIHIGQHPEGYEPRYKIELSHHLLNFANRGDKALSFVLESECSRSRFLSTTLYGNEIYQTLWNTIGQEVRPGEPLKALIGSGNQTTVYKFNFNAGIRTIILQPSESGVSAELELDLYHATSEEALRNLISFRKAQVFDEDRKALHEVANMDKAIQIQKRRPPVMPTLPGMPTPPVMPPMLPTPLPQLSSGALMSKELPPTLYEETDVSSTPDWPLFIMNTGQRCTFQMRTVDGTPGPINTLEQGGTVYTAWRQLIPGMNSRSPQRSYMFLGSASGHFTIYRMTPTPFVRVLTIKHNERPSITLENNWRLGNGTWANALGEQYANDGKWALSLEEIQDVDSSKFSMDRLHLEGEQDHFYAKSAYEAAVRRGISVTKRDFWPRPFYPTKGLQPQPSWLHPSGLPHEQAKATEEARNVVIDIAKPLSFVISSKPKQPLLDAPAAVTPCTALWRSRLLRGDDEGAMLDITVRDSSGIAATYEFIMTPYLHRIILDLDENGHPAVIPRYCRTIAGGTREEVPIGQDRPYLLQSEWRRLQEPDALDVDYLLSEKHLSKKSEAIGNPLILGGFRFKKFSPLSSGHKPQGIGSDKHRRAARAVHRHPASPEKKTVSHDYRGGGKELYAKLEEMKQATLDKTSPPASNQRERIEKDGATPDAGYNSVVMRVLGGFMSVVGGRALELS